MLCDWRQSLTVHYNDCRFLFVSAFVSYVVVIHFGSMAHFCLPVVLVVVLASIFTFSGFLLFFQGILPLWMKLPKSEVVSQSSIEVQNSSAFSFGSITHLFVFPFSCQRGCSHGDSGTIRELGDMQTQRSYCCSRWYLRLAQRMVRREFLEDTLKHLPVVQDSKKTALLSGHHCHCVLRPRIIMIIPARAISLPQL